MCLFLIDGQRLSGQLTLRTSTVFVVDDNDDFRSSVAWMLRGEGYQTVEFASANKAIRALKVSEHAELMQSCLLLDVRMPEMSGLEFHEVISRERIPIPVVYMTGHADVQLAVEAMKKGAITFLEKPLKPDQLRSAIESAIHSSLTLNPVERGGKVDHRQCVEFLSLLQTLTPRENEVLNGIVDGKPNKLIAATLEISVRTVEVHRARITKKLHTRSASELVKLVLTSQAIP